jgi:hypothetical protein
MSQAPSPQRHYVAGAVAVLGVKTSYVFGRMIGAQHQAAEQACDFILRNHTHTRLDVTLVEVLRALALVRQPLLLKCRQRRLMNRVGAGLHVDRDAVAGLNEIER